MVELDMAVIPLGHHRDHQQKLAVCLVLIVLIVKLHVVLHRRVYLVLWVADHFCDVVIGDLLFLECLVHASLLELCELAVAS